MPFAIPVAGLVLPTPSVSPDIVELVDKIFEPGEGGALWLCRAACVQDNNSIYSCKVVDIGLINSMESSRLCCGCVRAEPRRAKRKDPRHVGLRAQAQATNADYEG